MCDVNCEAEQASRLRYSKAQPRHLCELSADAQRERGYVPNGPRTGDPGFSVRRASTSAVASRVELQTFMTLRDRPQRWTAG
jgi:hypothetical protein